MIVDLPPTVRITKNVIMLGVAFMLHFSAYISITSLQSSLYADDSLGSYTLAIIYAFIFLSNLFLTVIMIRWLGCKWSIIVSLVAYMPFILAQFYPRSFTLIPTAILIGIAGGPLWCAKSTYLKVVAEAYSKLLNGDAEQQDGIVVRFFGLFFMLFLAAQILGFFVTSAVLSSSLGGFIGDMNGTANKELDIMVSNKVPEFCGAKYCPGVSELDIPNLQPPDPLKVQVLSVVFLALMLGGCGLVMVFVDSETRYDKERKGSGSDVSGWSLLSVNIRHLLQTKHLLMIPITLFVGAHLAFTTEDLPKSFLACGLGISRIGYVMIAFGVSNAISGAIVGGCSKWLGLMPMMWSNFAMHIVLFAWMRLWIAVANDYLTYGSMAFVSGFVDGFWTVQLTAYYAILNPGEEEAAFSCFRLIKAVGSFGTFASSPLMCTGRKIEALTILLVVGMIGFAITDRNRCKPVRSTSSESPIEISPPRFKYAQNINEHSSDDVARS